MSENPLPDELPRLLTATLLSIEGIRRDPAASEEDWREALDGLDRLDAERHEIADPTTASEVEAAITSARAALEAHEVEAARASLHRVGRALDAWVKRNVRP